MMSTRLYLGYTHGDMNSPTYHAAETIPKKFKCEETDDVGLWGTIEAYANTRTINVGNKTLEEDIDVLTIAFTNTPWQDPLTDPDDPYDKIDIRLDLNRRQALHLQKFIEAFLITNPID